jgi:hypothetical protein
MNKVIEKSVVSKIERLVGLDWYKASGMLTLGDWVRVG